MGYGARALQALNSFYSGEYLSLDESSRPDVTFPDAAVMDPVSTVPKLFLKTTDSHS
jgi:N-acetyltransferase 10